MVRSIEAAHGQSELYKLLSQKAVDGSTKGASLEDLKKEKISGEESSKPFVKFLAENFEKIDADKSGGLTVSEVNTYFKNQLGVSAIIPETTQVQAQTESAKTGKGPDILGGLMSLAQNEKVQNTIGAAINKAATAYGGQIGSKIASTIGLK